MKINKQEKVFITGANGFVGHFLVKKFTESGFSSLLLNCRNPEIHVKFKNNECTSLDITDEQSVHTFFEEQKPDHIIHLAAATKIADGEQYPDKAFITNYLGTKLLIDYAIDYEVKSFVFVSTDLVRNHKSVIGITKFLSEVYIQNCKKTSTKLIAIRLPNISWTPGSVHCIFEQLISDNKSITVTHPDMSRRFISGDEAAECIYHVFEKGKDRDLYIVNKPPEKITDLAGQMINDSGKKLSVEIIGMRAGEKVTEETYHESEVVNTGFKNLALMQQEVDNSENIKQAFGLLQKKRGLL